MIYCSILCNTHQSKSFLFLIGSILLHLQVLAVKYSIIWGNNSVWEEICFTPNIYWSFPFTAVLWICNFNVWL